MVNRSAACPGCISLERRVAALEADRIGRGGGHPRDFEYYAMIAELANGAPFTAVGLADRARTTPDLARVLDDMLIDQDAAQIGSWLRGMRDVPFDGVQLVRGKRTDRGYLWMVMNV